MEEACEQEIGVTTNIEEEPGGMDLDRMFLDHQQFRKANMNGSFPLVGATQGLVKRDELESAL